VLKKDLTGPTLLEMSGYSTYGHFEGRSVVSGDIVLDGPAGPVDLESHNRSVRFWFELFTESFSCCRLTCFCYCVLGIETHVCV
jgi:hypothetical protein